MPKYRITIIETVSQTSFVDVEAADELAALEIFKDDDLQFELDYTHIPGRDEVLTRELYSIAPHEPKHEPYSL
jgi:hypothetical protein